MSSRRPNINLIEDPTVKEIFAEQLSQLQPRRGARRRARASFDETFEDWEGWPEKLASNGPAHDSKPLLGRANINDPDDDDLADDEYYLTKEEEQDEEHEKVHKVANEGDPPQTLQGGLTASALSSFRLDIPRDMLNAFSPAFGGVDADGQENDHECLDPKQATANGPGLSHLRPLASGPRARARFGGPHGHSDKGNDEIGKYDKE